MPCGGVRSLGGGAGGRGREGMGGALNQLTNQVFTSACNDKL
jgi:hypothetical protein